MYYIITPTNLSDLTKYEWDCDFFGNTLDTEHTKEVYRQIQDEMDPLLICRDDKEFFYDIHGICESLYPNLPFETHTLKDSEYYKLFPKCWHNIRYRFWCKEYDKLSGGAFSRI